MTENNNKISFFTTGGTIDKYYNSTTQKNEFRENSNIPSYLKDTIGLDVEPQFKEILSIDSLDMTDDHRALIVKEINASSCDKIILTHGTDTMVKTAQYIEKEIPNINKTIILIGSMIPLDGFYRSDAPFNIGYAIAQAEQQTNGVYICMNATTFKSHEVEKNIEKSRFEYKEAS